MLKRSENPPVAYPADQNIGEIEGAWWVAHTKPRQEKAFAWDLLKKEMGYFLPMTEKVNIINGRKFRSLLPLFPSYVFVCSVGDDRSEFYTCARLVRALPVADQKKLRDELGHLQSALAGNQRVSPWPYLQKGRRCRVHSGPLKGVEGFFDHTKSGARLVLNVDTLGQAVALEIDAGLIEPLN